MSKQYSFIKPDPTLKNNLMAFGLEFDRGWYKLAEELFDKIQAIIDNNSKYNDIQLLQAKEKFGSMRLYFSHSIEEINDLVEKYEEKSSHICEVCGRPGKNLYCNHWYKTVCWWHHLLWIWNGFVNNIKYKYFSSKIRRNIKNYRQ